MTAVRILHIMQLSICWPSPPFTQRSCWIRISGQCHFLLSTTSSYLLKTSDLWVDLVSVRKNVAVRPTSETKVTRMNKGYVVACQNDTRTIAIRWLIYRYQIKNYTHFFHKTCIVVSIYFLLGLVGSVGLMVR